jgi:SSS family solute:Na+ symporter
MQLQFIDIALFLGFFAVVVGVSLYKSRREQDSEAYFLAGRSLTWPLIGLSIVAANISTEQMVGMSGQGAGGVGLAVSAWQLTGSIGIVLIAWTLLPRFLRAGIYTMPEFLEYRYNPLARGIMALLTVAIYVVVLLAAVLYSGGVTLRGIFDMNLTAGVWIIGGLAMVYTSWGGLKAVAWADLFQGAALLIGGLLTFFLGLKACGGWETFAAVNADKLHMILPADHPDLPWTGVAAGMWIVILYYCGLNQFIVQRNLAARTLRDGQLGMVLAGGLWLLVPFAIVMPGIMANQLYGEQLARADEAFPTLIRHLITPGLRGFMFAAIAGAVVSSLASMLNSASTVFTMDVYKRLIAPGASQKQLVLLGRLLTVVFVIVGCLIAPALDNPKFGGVFNYIQQFQGYIWPGVTAAFVGAFLLKRAPGSAAVAVLLGGPALYGIFQASMKQVHFLIQVLLTFVILMVAMAIITAVAPLREPVRLPERAEMNVRTEPVVYVGGGVVIAAVALFVVIFR